MTEENRNLERRLGELDFSDQSRVRDSLGRELSWKGLNRKSNISKSYSRNGGLNMLRKPIPAFALGIVVTLAVLGFSHPDTRAALAKLQQIFRIGENTVIYDQGATSSAALDSILAHVDQTQESGEFVFMHSVYGGLGSEVPEGADPCIKQFSSLRLAGEQVEYPLMVPTYFNERIPERLRFQKALVMPNGSVTLFFGIGPFETMLSHFQVGEGRSVSYSESSATMDKDGKLTTMSVTPDLEELEINGMKVTWQVHSEGVRRSLGGWSVKFPEKVIGNFIWEDDGMSYYLNGKFLTRDEGIKIIESLQPATTGKR